jgi:2-hydroxychromene-2-carboxylate isomerase
VPGALRTAVRAGEIGAGARFGLAAARLAFCGGFDLEDPEVLAEAAAAAGLTLDDCLAAAGDRSLDATLEATARGLRAKGVRELPAVRAGRRFHQGERGLAETAALLRATAAYVRPLAPVG